MRAAAGTAATAATAATAGAAAGPVGGAAAAYRALTLTPCPGQELANRLDDEQGGGGAQSREHLLKPTGRKRPRQLESRGEDCGATR